MRSPTPGYPCPAGLYLRWPEKALRIPQIRRRRSSAGNSTTGLMFLGKRAGLLYRARDVLGGISNTPLFARKVWLVTVADGADLAAYGIFYRQDNPEFGLKRVRLVSFSSAGAPVAEADPSRRPAET